MSIGIKTNWTKCPNTVQSMADGLSPLKNGLSPNTSEMAFKSANENSAISSSECLLQRIVRAQSLDVRTNAYSDCL